MLDFKWTPRNPNSEPFKALPKIMREQVFQFAKQKSRHMAEAIVKRVKAGTFADEQGNARTIPEYTEGYKRWRHSKGWGTEVLTATGLMLRSIKARVKPVDGAVELIIGFHGRRPAPDWLLKRREKLAKMEAVSEKTQGFTKEWVDDHMRNLGSGRFVPVAGFWRDIPPWRKARFNKTLENLRAKVAKVGKQTTFTNSALATLQAKRLGTGVWAATGRPMPILSMTTAEKDYYNACLQAHLAPHIKRALSKV